jgi:ubiquinone/menaquinone biosynthesis C-methylase UbiE
VSDWLLALLLAAVLIAFGWWALIATEGVYLGRRVVIWLYDLFAGRYDAIKHFDPQHDHMFLAQPLMARVAPLRAPYVLDVATGTGRLPLALLRHAQFEGPIVALDASRAMLDVAAHKLDGQAGVLLMQGDALRLPFADGEFDVVTCLEALEFTTQPDAVVRELCRVLRPGGWLLITNRRTGRLMPGKTYSQDRLSTLLTARGLGTIAWESWQVDYDLVWARKEA